MNKISRNIILAFCAFSIINSAGAQNSKAGNAHQKYSPKIFDSQKAVEQTELIYDTAMKCGRDYYISNSNNEIDIQVAEQIGKIRFGAEYVTSSQFVEAQSKKLLIQDEYRECSLDANKKIKDISKDYLENLSYAKIREAGVQYIVQSGTILSVGLNKNQADQEYTKFKALKNRIELEIGIF